MYWYRYGGVWYDCGVMGLADPAGEIPVVVFASLLLCAAIEIE